MKRLVVIGSIISLLAVSVGSSSAGASGGMQFTKLTTQPNAAIGLKGYAATKNWDASIHTIAFDGDNLIAGYGDWGVNSDSLLPPNQAGHTGIQPYSLSTNTWGDLLRTGTESNDVFRTINGHLYAPTTDPSSKPAGFATNRSGHWETFFPPDLAQAVHLLDITSPDNSDKNLIAFGATNNPPDSGGGTQGLATAWVSHDGGATWTTVAAEGSTPANATGGFERYYWGAALNGKVYFHGAGIMPAISMQVYNPADNDSVSIVPAGNNCQAYTPTGVVVFDGRIVCGTDTSDLMTFDGTALSRVQLPDGAGSPREYALNSGYLYVMALNGAIYRTTSWSQPFEYIGTFATALASNAQSMAVHNDRIYFGMQNADIYQSTSTITNRPAMAPTVSQVAPKTFTYDGKKHTVTVYGSDFMPGITASVNGQNYPVTYSNASTIKVVIDTATLVKPDKKTFLPATNFGALITSGSQTYSSSYDLTLTNPSSYGAQTVVANAFTANYTAAAPGTAQDPASTPSTTSPSSSPTRSTPSHMTGNVSVGPSAARTPAVMRLALNGLAATGVSLPMFGAAAGLLLFGAFAAYHTGAPKRLSLRK